MGKNRLFRTKLFMGYNKSDVDDYIALLEAEIEKDRAAKSSQPIPAAGLTPPAVPATPCKTLDRDIEKLTEDLNYLLGNTKSGGTEKIESHAKPHMRTKHEGTQAWNGSHTQGDQDIFILKEDS